MFGVGHLFGADPKQYFKNEFDIVIETNLVHYSCYKKII